MLIARERPNWAKRRYYLLASVFGLSTMIRAKLCEESQETDWNCVKLITEIDAKV